MGCLRIFLALSLFSKWYLRRKWDPVALGPLSFTSHLFSVFSDCLCKKGLFKAGFPHRCSNVCMCGWQYKSLGIFLWLGQKPSTRPLCEIKPGHRHKHFKRLGVLYLIIGISSLPSISICFKQINRAINTLVTLPSELCVCARVCMRVQWRWSSPWHWVREASMYSAWSRPCGTSEIALVFLGVKRKWNFGT